MASLLTGFVLGAGRLVLELVHGADQQGLPAGSIWAAIAEFNFLHFALVLFVISVVILVSVSLATGAPPRHNVANLTYATADEKFARGAADEAPALTHKPRWRADALLSVLLARMVALVWLYFSPLVL